jgi:hypothetical protein
MVYGITGAGSGLYGSGNMFQGGRVQAGTNLMQLVPYEDGKPAYNTDWNNIAPSVGIAWRPTLKSKTLSKIFSSDPVFRGGYSLTYTRLGTDFFDGNYSEYEADRKKRLGAAADQPHRIRYRQLTR